MPPDAADATPPPLRYADAAMPLRQRRRRRHIPAAPPIAADAAATPLPPPPRYADAAAIDASAAAMPLCCR
jgi:hypothetical protein